MHFLRLTGPLLCACGQCPVAGAQGKHSITDANDNKAWVSRLNNRRSPKQEFNSIQKSVLPKWKHVAPPPPTWEM